MGEAKRKGLVGRMWEEMFLKRAAILAGFAAEQTVLPFSHPQYLTAAQLTDVLGCAGKPEYIVTSVSTHNRYLLECVLDAKKKPRAVLISKTRHLLPVTVHLPESAFQGSLLDGHLSPDHEFCVCDVLALNGQTLTHEDFYTRISALQDLLFTMNQHQHQRKEADVDLDLEFAPMRLEDDDDHEKANDVLDDIAAREDFCLRPIQIIIKDFYFLDAAPRVRSCPRRRVQAKNQNGLMFIPVQAPWGLGSRAGIFKVESEIRMDFVFCLREHPPQPLPQTATQQTQTAATTITTTDLPPPLEYDYIIQQQPNQKPAQVGATVWAFDLCVRAVHLEPGKRVLVVVNQCHVTIEDLGRLGIPKHNPGSLHNQIVECGWNGMTWVPIRCRSKIKRSVPNRITTYEAACRSLSPSAFNSFLV